jgi:hypothetical protein
MTSRTVISGETVIGIAQHARLEALHLRHLGRLRRRGQVLVHDADAAFLRDGDGEPRLGDRVHGRGHERQVELEPPGEPGLQRDFSGQDAGVGGEEENVVEGQRLLDHPHENSFTQSGIIREGPRQPSLTLRKSR